jgi:hypothetical protein
MIIKAIAREPWGDQPKTYSTWYNPFEDADMIQKCVDFSLSHKVTGLCTAADKTLLPHFLEACQNFSPMAEKEQQALIATAGAYQTIFE